MTSLMQQHAIYVKNNTAIALLLSDAPGKMVPVLVAGDSNCLFHSFHGVGSQDSRKSHALTDGSRRAQENKQQSSN